MTGSFRPGHTAALVFVLGVALATGAALWQRSANMTESTHELKALAENVTQQIATRMHLYAYGLRGLRGAYLVDHSNFNRRRFDIYSQSRDIATEFPGARGFGLILRVPRQDEARFIARARQDDWPDFAIRQLTPQEGDRFVIQYLAPIENNRAAIGLDIASETNRREAARAAMYSGEATLSGPITLVQNSGAQARSFLLLLPIFRPGTDPATDEQRAAATVGWAYAPLIIDEVLHQLIENDGRYTLVLRDMSVHGEQSFFKSPNLETTDTRRSTTHRITLPMFGRAWEAEVRGTPKFAQSLRLRAPSEVLLSGILLSSILAYLAYVLVQSRLRKQETLLEQARRATIIENSTDAIIGQTLDGVITDWNHGAEVMFGYSRAEALNQALASLVPVVGEDNTADTKTGVVHGVLQAPYESVRRHRDGRVIDVSISMAAISDPAGRCVGLSMTLRDISETKQAQLALTKINAHLEGLVQERTARLETARHSLQTIMDAIPSMVGYWDKDLINRAANTAYHTWLGIAPEAIPGKHMREVLGDALFERNLPFIEAALRGEPQHFERSIPRPDGTGLRHSLAHYIPDVAEGKVRGFHVLVHDVSEIVDARLQLAAALRDNAALLQTIRDQTIVSVTDQAGRITDVNEMFCKISGYSREELLGSTHRIVNSGSHPAEFWRSMWKTISSGKSWRQEVCNRAKDGSLYWVDSIVAPFMNEDGSIERYISIRTDITQRKQIDTQLEAISSLLTEVLDAASEISIIATDPQGLITVFNRGAEQLLGYSAAEMVGVCSPAVIHLAAEVEQRGAELSATHHRPITGFEVFVHEACISGAETRQWTYVRKNGSHVPVLLTVTAIRNARGEIRGYLGIASDVSRQQAYEQSLRDAMLSEKKANLAKSQFLANMSHEIRTPMNAVIGLAHLLARTPLNPDQSSLLDKLQSSGSALLTIINDILDLSKVEAGELKIEHAPFELDELIHDLSELFSTLAREKNIEFSVSKDVPPGTMLASDVTRLRQILVNLLSNALKFTAEGSVRLRVRSMLGTPSLQRLRFEVKDTGIGIPEEAIPRLFQVFSQEDASTTRRFGGTGLGLSITKQLVKLMQGDLGVESRQGEGSLFWVELEFLVGAKSQARKLPKSAPGSGQGLRDVRILLVDDSEVNRVVAQRILELEGATVALACNGQEAVDQLRAGPEAFDVVLMDIHMPVMDGHEATGQIRTQLHLSVPIIALTAGMPGIAQKEALASGMNDFVGKPFNPAQLVNCIRSHLKFPPPVPQALPADAELARDKDDWPAIDGIETPRAHSLFDRDRALFRQLLKRLLDDFLDLQDLHLPLTEYASLRLRLHDLKGSSGTLGACAISAMAAQAEQACKDENHTALNTLLPQLVDALRQLRERAMPVLNHPDDAMGAKQPETAGSTMEPAELESLIDLLSHNDLAAVDCFHTIGPRLSRYLHSMDYAELARKVNSLDFGSAVALLQRALHARSAHEQVSSPHGQSDDQAQPE